MKKGLLAIIAALAIGTAAMAQFTSAQGDNGIPDLSAKSSRTYTRQWEHIGTPFVANDIYGNRVSLQDYLDSGIFVIIDYSCTWCGPCWNLHRSGMLEQLDTFANFQVIWVECESTNTTAQIFGTSGGSGRAGTTQGNWTLNANGDTIEYPIIDDDANSTCLRTCAALYQGSVPTLMLITPDGLYTNLVNYFSYQQVAQSITNIRSIANSAPKQGDAPVCKISASTTGITGYPISLKAVYNTVDPITSVNWTITGGTPSTATGENVTTSFNNNGPHRVIVEVTNANGSDYDTITIITSSIPANALSYAYGKTKTSDVGSSTSGARTWAVSFPPEFLSNFPQLHHVETFINASYPGSYTMKAYSGTASAPQTELCSVPVNVTAAMGNALVSFTPSSPVTIDQTKTLWIVMSATGTYPMAGCAYTGYENSDWILNGSSWYHLRDVSNVECSWLINAFSSVNGISLASDNEVRLFPNPATDNVSILADGVRYVEVIDMNGTTVMKVNDAKTINIENLSSGVYVFRVVTDNGVAMRKVVKK